MHKAQEQYTPSDLKRIAAGRDPWSRYGSDRIAAGLTDAVGHVLCNVVRDGKYKYGSSGWVWHSGSGTERMMLGLVKRGYLRVEGTGGRHWNSDRTFYPTEAGKAASEAYTAEKRRLAGLESRARDRADTATVD